MTKDDVLKVEEAVLEACMRLKVPVDGIQDDIRRAARYAATCTVGRASFSQTRPPVPIVTLKNGRRQPAIRVLQGTAMEQVVHTFCVKALSTVRWEWTDVRVRAAVEQALKEVLPGLESRVESSVKALLGDGAAVQKKKDQLEREDADRRSRERERMVRELRNLSKAGFTEEDVVLMYREALVGEVLGS